MKLGATDGLNRFDCCLIDDGICGYQIKFILKKNVPEAIGVPYATGHLSNQSNDDDSDESADNEFTRNEPIWRDRRRGISMSNTKECNEIVRQFFEIDFDESMILTEPFNEVEVSNSAGINM